MKFGRGKFGRAGQFDRTQVTSFYDVDPVTVAVAPSFTPIVWVMATQNPTAIVAPTMISPVFTVTLSSGVTVPAVMYYFDLDWYITIGDDMDTQWKFYFNNGGIYGNYPPSIGNTIGHWTGSFTGVIVSFTVESGSWAAGNAAGYFIIDHKHGTFVPTADIYDFTQAQYIGNVVSAETLIPPYTGLQAIVAGSKFADWTLNPISASVRGVKTPVTASIYIPTPPTPPTPDTSLTTSMQASMKMNDKMMTAKVTYELATSGVIPSTYFKNLKIYIPDYTTTRNRVFDGFFPSGEVTVEYVDEHIPNVNAIRYESVTAYSYDWYLTMQYLNATQKVFLTPENQALVKKYQIYYHYPNTDYQFEQGQVVIGETSGDWGTILEVYQDIAAWPYDGSYLIYQATAGMTFQDGENLLVNGVAYAHSDGIGVDVTGVVATITPDTYVSGLLGGENYENVTKIKPYLMYPCAWSASSDPVAVEFDFEEKTTKYQAIERIAKYIHYIFLVKPKTVSGYEYAAAAYFGPESLLDDGSNPFDIPAKQSFSNPNAYIDSPVTIDRKGEERYNKVTVRCQSLDQKYWYESVQQTTGVKNGDEPPIEYYEINEDIASQSECDERCLDLYNYYSNVVTTYTVTFLMRSDLQLLQLVAFSGYTDIPSADYRIVGIHYRYEEGGSVNEVVCTLVANTQFKFYLNLNRVFTDAVTEIQNIVRGELAKMGQVEVCEVTAVDSGVVTGVTEAGIPITMRDPTA